MGWGAVVFISTVRNNKINKKKGNNFLMVTKEPEKSGEKIRHDSQRKVQKKHFVCSLNLC